MRIQNQTHDAHAIAFMREGKKRSMLLMSGQTIEADGPVGQLPKGVVELKPAAPIAPTTTQPKD